MIEIIIPKYIVLIRTSFDKESFYFFTYCRPGSFHLTCGPKSMIYVNHSKYLPLIEGYDLESFVSIDYGNNESDHY